MRAPLIVAAVLVLALGAAAVVFAQLSGSQTASGTVTVSSTAADLYICEPGGTPGPACGSDDSGADEAIFEGLENIRPGETKDWDIRLKNIGSQDFVVSAVTLSVVETADPGGDCPDNALRPPLLPFSTTPQPVAGVLLLGKAGDPVNDNPFNLAGAATFIYQVPPPGAGLNARNIKIAAGDYEDVRLQLALPVTLPTPTPFFPPPTPPTPSPGGTIEGCAGNEWNVAFTFTAT